jgi:mono/diheme cytochrome c family protein
MLFVDHWLKLPMIPINFRLSEMLLGILLLCAPALLPATEPGTPNAALLYHNYCSVCHGDKGDGNSRGRDGMNPPPRNFTDPEAKRVLVRERIISSIGHGRPNTAMIGWSTQLDATEIAALADYLLARFIDPQDGISRHPGKPLYEHNCAVCHGDRGDGGRWTSGMSVQPRDFTSERGRALSRDTMIEAVTHGRPGTAMASFAGQLTAQQIGDVADYIRLAFMALPDEIKGLSGTYAHGRVVPAAPIAPAPAQRQAIDMDAPMPRGLIGNLAAGRDFYMGNCFTCHGVNGDGQGPRAYFIRPKPANFFDTRYQQGFNRVALFNAINDGKLGTEMPAWGKVLTVQQIADLAEFVFRAFIQNDKSILQGSNGEKKKT